MAGGGVGASAHTGVGVLMNLSVDDQEGPLASRRLYKRFNNWDGMSVAISN